MEKAELENLREIENLGESAELDPLYRTAMKLLIIAVIGALSFLAGLVLSSTVHAQSDPPGGAKQPKVIYPAKTSLDFEGSSIEGELKNPGEFYFQHRPEEKMESLVKRRKNFHRELLRDAMLSK